MEFTLPQTKEGQCAAGLFIAFVVMLGLNGAGVFMPGFVMVLSSLASGAFGFVAVALKHEKSALVWLTLLQALFVFGFGIGEVLGPPPQ
jgi:hypothetical protein